MQSFRELPVLCEIKIRALSTNDESRRRKVSPASQPLASHCTKDPKTPRVVEHQYSGRDGNVPLLVLPGRQTKPRESDHCRLGHSSHQHQSLKGPSGKIDEHDSVGILPKRFLARRGIFPNDAARQYAFSPRLRRRIKVSCEIIDSSRK